VVCYFLLPPPPPPPALRAAILGEAADAAARVGRFDEALGYLGRAAALGREGEAQAEGRRAEILGCWFARLAADGDDAGVAIVYAAHATELHALASTDDRLTIGRALARLGLHAPALRILGTRNDPALAVARAEEQLAMGDVESARATIQNVPGPSEGIDRVAARIALAAGDLGAAADHAARTDDAAVRIAVAAALLGTPADAATASALVQPLVAAGGEAPVRTLLVAGAAAAAEGAWTAAEDAYRRALAAGVGGDDATVGRIGGALAAREIARGR
jgi:tetratricopeptide (TPR) repeat protein